jgi:hypothetical protein
LEFSGQEKKASQQQNRKDVNIVHT